MRYVPNLGLSPDTTCSHRESSYVALEVTSSTIIAWVIPGTVAPEQQHHPQPLIELLAWLAENCSFQTY